MLGVYVHFPYCLARCPYCDFASQVAETIPHEAYADAILAELDLRLEGGWPRGPVGTIYLGGGTPSLWAPRAVARLLRGLHERLEMLPDPEITLEANPGASESGTLAALREAGVNRISFGTQSTLPRVLETLGRWHRAEESLSAVERARAAGLSRVSLDLIYAVPGQTPKEAARDARALCATGPGHVSAYALTLEANVPMAVEVAEGRVRLPDEATAVAIEDAVLEALASAGYARYEISNHARPGEEARHNTLYWTGAPYLGLGVSAAGYRPLTGGRAERTTNARTAERYLSHLRAGRLPHAQRETLEPRTVLGERLFLGLRLSRGVDLSALADTTGLDPWALFGPALERFEAQGLLVREGSRVRPTDLGLRFHDTLALAFVE